MRRVAWVIVPVMLVGLLGLAAFAARGPGATTAFTLKVGDCFDIPGDSQVGDIATVDCSAPHDAEAFATETGALSALSASTGPPDYPGDAAFGDWVGANCGDAAQRDYLGAEARADLRVGYFYPDANAWARGERQVTCYLHTIDGSKLDGPLRGASATGSPGSS
jgi:hypothetical protein